MSNAMRFGKRSLAGAAAGALALGTLAFAGTTSAVAAPNVKPKTVSTITQLTPGLTIVKPPTVDDSVSTKIPVSVLLTDEFGNPIDLESTETLRATVNSPDGAIGNASTSFALTGARGTPGPAAFADVNLTTNSSGSDADDTGVYNVFLTPVNNTQRWNEGTGSIPAGNFTVTIRYANTLTGGTQNFTVPVQILSSAARPTANMSWRANAAGIGTVNTASAPVDDTVAPQYSFLATSAGYPIIGRPALVAGTTSVAFGSSDTTLVTTSGFGPVAPATSDDSTAVMTQAPGVFTLSPDNAANRWSTAASANYISTYSTQSSSLPIVFGSATGGFSTARITSTPSLTTTTPAQIPAGTTTMTFVVTADDTASGSVAWRVSSRDGGQVTPSAGIAVFSNNQATITVTLDATAAASGNLLTLSSRTATWASAAGSFPNYQVSQAALAPTVTAPATLIGKIGDSVALAGAVTDQFGRALTGSWIVSVAKVTAPTTVLATTTSNSTTGAFELTIPASASPTTAGNVAYTTSATNGLSTARASTTVTYNATGNITSLTAATSPPSVGGLVPALLVPGTGTVSLGTTTAAVVAPGSTTNATAVPTTANVARIQATANPATSITLTAPDGVYLSRSVSGQVNWNGGVQTLVVPSGTTVSVWTTKQGASTITAAAGGLTSTVQVYGFTQASFARNITVDKDKAEIAPNQFTTIQATITDVFGNPLFNVTSANVAVSLAGGGTISPTATTATGVDGKTSVSYTSPAAAGTARVQFTGTGAQFQSTITGADAAKRIATTDITVTSSATKSIVIVGERTTVSGKPGILVDGSTKGFDVGTKMVPNVRFPGQTSFTAGSARPTTSAIGEFSWQRKTGKKTTVFFTNEAGDVVSNRVVIPAN